MPFRPENRICGLGCGGGWRPVPDRGRTVLEPCLGPLRRALEPGLTVATVSSCVIGRSASTEARVLLVADGQLLPVTEPVAEHHRVGPVDVLHRMIRCKAD